MTLTGRGGGRLPAREGAPGHTPPGPGCSAAAPRTLHGGCSSGVQSSACFCQCFDDAFECSHHDRDAAAPHDRNLLAPVAFQRLGLAAASCLPCARGAARPPAGTTRGGGDATLPPPPQPRGPAPRKLSSLKRSPEALASTLSQCTTRRHGSVLPSLSRGSLEPLLGGRAFQTGCPDPGSPRARGLQKRWGRGWPPLLPATGSCL